MKTPFLIIMLAICAVSQLCAADTDVATTAINSLGIDLLKATGKPDKNALLSPYSIQSALAMTYAGSDGMTREEMAKTLHFPKDDAGLGSSFAALQKQLLLMVANSLVAANAIQSTDPKRKPKEPIALNMANQLFGQSGFEFQQSFLDFLKESYNAPLEELDFKADPNKAREQINNWVGRQTLDRIQNLIPEQELKSNAILVLVNAIYLKAQWNNGFKEILTKPAPFHINGGAVENVPTMQGFEMRLGFDKRDGYTAVTIPYTGSELQFLILLPDKVNGIAALESKLTPELLAGFANTSPILVDISLPKFKLEPPVMKLNEQLKALGMKSAFNENADFSRMAPGKLYISGVFHKTFFSLDEHGTEAAAATAVSIYMLDGDAPGKIHIDHPFIFAIQDRKSGACIFIGHVTDPRSIAQPKTSL